MSSAVGRIAKNTGYLYLKMGVTMFISLWITRIILNSLGASDFGIFNIVGGAISMLGFLNASMANATQRFMSYYLGNDDIEKCKRIFNSAIVLHITISIIISLLLLAVGILFFNEILNIPEERKFAAKVVYYSLIVSTAFTMISVPYDAIINAHENMKFYAIVGLLESFFKLIVAFAILYTIHDRLIMYGFLMACVPIITMIIMCKYCHRNYEECIVSPIEYWDTQLTKEMGKFAGWRLLNSFSSVFTQYGLGLVLNHFYGTILNAAQGIANQLSGQLMAFSNTMLKALNPVITKNEGKGKRTNMVSTTLYGCKISYLILVVFAIPAIIEIPYILKIWVKTIPEYCIIFCQLQLIRSVIEQLTITMPTAIMAQGQIKNFSIIKSLLDIFAFALTFVFFYFEMPPYMMYVAWISCGSIIGNITMLYYSHKFCSVTYKDYFKIVLLPCFMITLLMCVLGTVPSCLFTPSLYRLILVLLLTTAGMLVSMYLMMSRIERSIMTNAIYNVKKRFKFQL